MTDAKPPDPTAPGASSEAITLERYKAELAGWLERYKATLSLAESRRTMRTELLKASHASTIDFARGVIRGALIINGGGSLATTTMLAASLQHRPSGGIAFVLAVALASFATGAVLSIVSSGFSYFAQQHFSNDVNNRRGTPSRMGGAWRVAAVCALWISGTCFVFSVAWTVLKLPSVIEATFPTSQSG